MLPSQRCFLPAQNQLVMLWRTKKRIHCSWHGWDDKTTTICFWKCSFLLCPMKGCRNIVTHERRGENKKVTISFLWRIRTLLSSIKPNNVVLPKVKQCKGWSMFVVGQFGGHTPVGAFNKMLRVTSIILSKLLPSCPLMINVTFGTQIEKLRKFLTLNQCIKNDFFACHCVTPSKTSLTKLF